MRVGFGEFSEGSEYSEGAGGGFLEFSEGSEYSVFWRAGFRGGD